MRPMRRSPATVYHEMRAFPPGGHMANRSNSDWVTNQARNQVVKTFHEMRALQIERYHAHLQSQPYYTLYHRYNGAPPLAPSQLQQVRADMLRAEQMLKAGVDEAWRASCLKYPEIMDYYFSLVIFDLPSDRDPAVRDPTFGGGGPGAVGGREVAPSRQLKVRRDSVERDHRKKERRRSRGRTPPPQVPLAPAPYSRPR